MNEQTKICPLLTAGNFAGNSGHYASCPKECCAWWDTSLDRCALLSILSNLDELGGALIDGLIE